MSDSKECSCQPVCSHVRFVERIAAVFPDFVGLEEARTQAARLDAKFNSHSDPHSESPSFSLQGGQEEFADKSTPSI